MSSYDITQYQEAYLLNKIGQEDSEWSFPVIIIKPSHKSCEGKGEGCFLQSHEIVKPLSKKEVVLEIL